MDSLEDASGYKRQKTELRHKAKIGRLENKIAEFNKKLEAMEAKNKSCSELNTTVFNNSFILNQRFNMQSELEELSVNRCVAKIKQKAFNFLTPIISKLLGVEDPLLQYQSKEEVLLKKIERLAEENKGLQMQVASLEEELENTKTNENILEKALIGEKEKCKVLTEENEKLKMEIKSVKDGFDALCGKHVRLEENHEVVKRNAETLKKALRMELESNRCLQKTCEKLKGAQQDMQIKAECLKKALTVEREKNEAMKEDHEKVTKALKIELVSLKKECHTKSEDFEVIKKDIRCYATYLEEVIQSQHKIIRNLNDKNRRFWSKFKCW
eukprot:gene8091-8958_t